MKDPEVDSFDSDSDSTEMEDDFDFVTVAKERTGTLFKGKKKKEANEKSVAELMRRNDLVLMRKAIDKLCEHEFLLKRSSQLQTQFKNQIKQLQIDKVNLIETDEKLQEELSLLRSEHESTNSQLIEFKDAYFPNYMS